MVAWIQGVMQGHPEIAFFLVLGLGYLLGKLALGSFKLGAVTATPALAAVQEVARSSVPSTGYGVAYAVGNVFLAIWGTVIVVLMT